MRLYQLLFLIVFLASHFTWAAHVEKVKGKKALIILDGLSVSVGDAVEAYDPSTEKRTAILKVTKISGDKAVAKLVRGKVSTQFEIKLKGLKSADSESDEEDSPEEMPTSKTKRSESPKSDSSFAVGGLFGVGFDNMNIKIGSPVEEIKQTGTGFGLVGALDYKLASWFSFRGLAGVEQFNVEGDSVAATICDTCETKLTYFTVMGWGRILVTETFWLGAGLGLQHPLSDESNALDPKYIGTTAVYGLGTGVDIPLTESMYMPIQVEYGMQPSSDTVTVSYYSLRLGIMLNY